MYTLQKPDFEVLLLAELQRQQQCKHLCDVLLKAKGINTNNSFCCFFCTKLYVFPILSNV